MTIYMSYDKRFREALLDQVLYGIQEKSYKVKNYILTIRLYEGEKKEFKPFLYVENVKDTSHVLFCNNVKTGLSCLRELFNKKIETMI